MSTGPVANALPDGAKTRVGQSTVVRLMLVVSITSILQVEDDANDVFLLQRAFTNAGITNPVQVVTDGQMAIDYLAGYGRFANRTAYPLPGLVLLDLKLPHKSGREVLQWIRGQPGFRRIVIIVFTTAQYAGDVGLAYDLGVNSFLVKPTDFSQYQRIALLLKEWWLHFNQFAPISEALWTPSTHPSAMQHHFDRPSAGNAS